LNEWAKNIKVDTCVIHYIGRELDNMAINSESKGKEDQNKLLQIIYSF